jgi:hypothetical protein
MKTLLLVICLSLPAISLAGEVLTQKTDCVLKTTPVMPGKCQLIQDEKGTVWLVFWDDTKKILFIRTRIDGEYVYMYKRKLGIPV